MLDRIMGVITLKSATYRSIADDQTATTQAAMIVIIVSLISGFFSGLVRVTADGVVQTSVVGGVTGAIVGVLLGLLSWVVASWVLSAVASAMGGKTNTGEMMRVTGFVQVFGLVSILNILVLVSPALGCITGLMGLVVAILSLIGYVIGVREAAEFDTTKAIIAAIVAAIANFLITVVVAGVILTAVAGAMSLAGG
jgi:Yip1 domain